MEDAEDLDDVDKELLGMADVGDDDADMDKDGEDDQDLDDLDRTLLGMGDRDSDSD